MTYPLGKKYASLTVPSASVIALGARADHEEVATLQLPGAQKLGRVRNFFLGWQVLVSIEETRQQVRSWLHIWSYMVTYGHWHNRQQDQALGKLARGVHYPLAPAADRQVCDFTWWHASRILPGYLAR